MQLEIVAMGLFAGGVTTVAGMGGGLLLTLVLAWWLDPLQALVVTAPALLVGNLHRIWLYRREVRRGLALSMVVGALPGAVVGGWVAGWISVELMRALMAVMCVGAVARAMKWIRWAPPRRLAMPVGALAGVVNATCGGAGTVLGPFLIARGLSGSPYVGTMGVAAVGTHIGRLAGYASAGHVASTQMALGLGLAGAIAVGNLGGVWMASWLGERARYRLQVLTLAACVLLAVVGLRSGQS